MKEQAIYKQPKVIVPIVILGVVAAYYLVTEHNAHVRSVLPTVLLLAFVLLHMRMHGGHGGHGSHGAHGKDVETSSTSQDNSGAKSPHEGHGGHK